MAYPNELTQVEQLITDHKGISEEPLVLAIYFATDPASNDVHILEVLDGFGYNEVSKDNELFEVEYASTNGFRLENNARLHLVLTNPKEFQHAIDQKWPEIKNIESAIKAKNYRSLYATDSGKELLNKLYQAALAA